MSDPLTFVPIIILFAEVLITFSLSRKRIKRRLFWVIGSYLVFIALALTCGLLGGDEFGFSWIPLLTITEPWIALIHRLTNLVVSFTQSLYGIILGILMNCILFYLIDRLSYPNSSIRTSARHTT